MTPHPLDAILRYHDQTKHRFERYARSPEFMDWRHQPDPFRSYEATPAVSLPLLKTDPEGLHADLYRRDRNRPQPITLESVAGFLELSLALSAWKAVGADKWSLRINPSSGNLHPTEAHLILPSLDTLTSGVYHYNSLRHALEHRMGVPDDLMGEVQAHLGSNGFLVALTSIFWRESWKYGERAYRYCNHDVGHALAALSFSANLFGWRVVALGALSDDDIDAMIGLDRVTWRALEQEHADLLCFVHDHRQVVASRGLPDERVAAFSGLSVSGRPNALSPDPVNWEIIGETSMQVRKPRTAEDILVPIVDVPMDLVGASETAAQIIRQRRSAMAYDMAGAISKDRFFRILDATRVRKDHAPFDVGLMPPMVHLLLFVHNVEGLQRGLYFLVRNPSDLESLKQDCSSDFRWQPVAAHLPLFLLSEGDFRMTAIDVSCHQEIAGLSAFSLGMIVNFREAIQDAPYRYRHLFWETGMIGQVLYLEAEAQGVRGTGIGCFFDDAVHELLGLTDDRWQSLYHFTIGHPVEDARLTTLPPYHHLETV
jgi:SagB-type dehydrogenase family enzyme